MPMVRDGGLMANPAHVEHLTRLLRAGLFVCLHGGGTKAILVVISVNSHKLAVLLFP